MYIYYIIFYIITCIVFFFFPYNQNNDDNYDKNYFTYIHRHIFISKMKSSIM